MDISNTTLQRVLIIDDNGDYRKLLLGWISSQFPGVEAVEYDPVKQGVPGQEFDWARFDVLLLDYELQLQDTTGLDILQANYNNENFPATIMLTGAGSEVVAVRAFKYEVTDYLRKEWTDKNQIKSAIENAFSQKLLKFQRANMLDISRQIAQAESEKIIYDLINKFEKQHEMEHVQIKMENQRIKEELLNNQEFLKKIEQEKDQAEKTKQKLMQEMERLKAMLHEASDRAGVNDKLESTHQKLEQTQAGIEQIHEDYQIVKSEIDKNIWKKEQDLAFQKKLQDDLSEFEVEFEHHQQELTGMNTKLKMEMLKKMKELKSKQSEEEIREKELFREITSQLHSDHKP